MSNVIRLNTALNFGPGQLRQESQQGNQYVLSRADWAAIQAYAQNGLSLPTNDEEFRVYANLKPGASIPNISDIYDAYKKVHEHCNTWQHDTFPQTVSLASDLVNYNTYTKTYYPALQKRIDDYLENPTDKVLKELTAIINLLQKKATEFHDRAVAAETAVTKFADDTANDQTVIQKLDENYNKQMNDEDGVVTKLKKQISDLTDQFNKLNDEYNRDVVIAATTPTYAWATIFGFIAAVVVAGTYGAAAAACKRQMDEIQKQINSLTTELNTDLNILAALTSASKSLGFIKESINNALPALQKAKGSWKALADDLKSLQDLIKNAISDQDPELWNLGLDAAADSWAKVGQDADDYRHFAFVTFVTSQTA
ncbi:alpha-xenorhabdolysin family binary toxin subunit A [Paenibacillus athensensis]|nr:alpha-xenorhabdolysin family binary toxin subunit A [Paenibacillus athensensis]MCD1257244.1 alpha-xenorhabdolysin family binary toxin subunit A [Paenibacillus athensensis]